MELPSALGVDNEDFTLDVYVTRSGELKKFSTLSDQLQDLDAAAVDGSRQVTLGQVASYLSSTAREAEEELVDVLSPVQQSSVPSAANRGARLRVFEGRPDLPYEIRRAFLNPVTGMVEGDVMRKLVLVCGPESMVADVVAAAAEIGVAVHTEEFLL
ncbi:hypothetical protein ABL78_8346 [Leptomonas seymouri]|uniref:Ferric reductase NAD binding domain-containing protein n=1 Tax=Leptomonas seymouri TaxID=5684 RepID=A0A0N1P9I5_LEPSE|nr:hypothetical protein ABL78_8346 [Leptomonas seymouri]|eukprot:KPI82641.1 hypothetical protein ABL78_8346 [Leptomonas seymouri]